MVKDRVSRHSLSSESEYHSAYPGAAVYAPSSPRLIGHLALIASSLARAHTRSGTYPKHAYS